VSIGRVRPATLVLVAMVLVSIVPAGAAAADCPDPGGGTLPKHATASGELVIHGRGWGHGTGMSQYGARGAASLGCSAGEILTTYYPGTKVADQDLPNRIRVALATSADWVPVTAVSGSITWELCALDQTGCTTVATQAKGATWTVDAHGSNEYRLHQGTGDGGALVWKGAQGDKIMVTRFEPQTIKIGAAGGGRDLPYRYGLLEIDGKPGSPGLAYVNLDIGPFDNYLYGLGEVPFSWPTETLRAQVIAARTYAVNRTLTYKGNRSGCRCDVYATTKDQNYVGARDEAASWGAPWRAAVEATRDGTASRATLVLHDGKPISAFYSSSHGGHSESYAFWGGTDIPYLKAVDDSAWEAASGNSLSAWTTVVKKSVLESTFGVSNLKTVRLPHPLGAAGRVGNPDFDYGGVELIGSKTVRVSGTTFRSRLGLRSTLFTGSGSLFDESGPPPDPDPSPDPTPSPGPSPSPGASEPTEPIVEIIDDPVDVTEEEGVILAPEEVEAPPPPPPAAPEPEPEPSPPPAVAAHRLAMLEAVERLPIAVPSTVSRPAEAAPSPAPATQEVPTPTGVAPSELRAVMASTIVWAQDNVTQLGGGFAALTLVGLIAWTGQKTRPGRIVRRHGRRRRRWQRHHP